MRNLKLEIEYDGTAYAGWQIQKQPASGTIQAIIEKALQKILQEKVKLIAAGRTDAGVHALAQAANFKTKSRLPPQRIRAALNALLPDNIVVTKSEDVALSFNSRYAAKAKTYCYVILNRAYPSAFLKNKVYFYTHTLNLSLMRKEAKALEGRHDFSSFQGALGKRNPQRTIKQIKIVKQGDLLYTYVKGQSFLYRMVRTIIGTLLEVGRGKLPPGSLKKILRARNRKIAGPTAPACGLYLLKVDY